MTNAVFILFGVFYLKHFIADYPLQRPWMLGKFKPGIGFILPLTMHCLVHAALTFIIVLGCAVWHPISEKFLWLPLFDFITHFAMDRVKASPNMMGRWKALSATEYAKIAGWMKDFKGFTSKDAYRQSTIVKQRDENVAKIRGNRMFWNSLGFDQLVHHTTDAIIIWFLVH